MKYQVAQIIEKAGKVLEQGFREAQHYTEKERRHLQSEYDLRTEKILISGIEALFPQDAIYSEESSEKKGSSEARWIMDPIDGTAYFIFGEPYFSISLAREVKGEIVEGHVYNPLSREYYYSDIQRGKSYLNGREIGVSAIDRLDQALLTFGFSANPPKMREYMEMWEPVMTRCRKALPWICPALSICNVARGRVEGFIDSGCSMEGQAAASLILRNAGGKLTDWDGTAYNHSNTGGIFTNGRLSMDSN